MAVTRGAEHVFLGMDIKYRGDGKFQILMKEYLEETIEEFERFGEKLVASTATPATKNLFFGKFG